jgi:outer membrane protein TolC
MRVLKFFVVLMALTGIAAAQTNAPKTRILSLQDCIVIALEDNFDIQIHRYDPIIARYTLFGTYGAYDPVLSMSGEHAYNLSPGGVDPQGRAFGGVETDTDTVGASLSGLLPWGLQYGIGGSLSDQTGTRPSFITDPNNIILTSSTFSNATTGGDITLVQTNFGVLPTRSPFETTSGRVGILDLRQPLLKNFWIDTTRLAIFINKRELKIAEADFRDLVMDRITAVESAYLNLIFAEENVRVQEKALELANRLLAENRRRVEVGALAPLDEKQAESQVASSRADLLSAQATRDTLQRVLKDLLSDNYTNTWADVMIVPSDKLVALPEQYNLQESWTRGLARGPRQMLQQTRLRLEEQKQQVKFRRNQLYPQVDLLGSYGFNASEREFGGALDQVRHADNPYWTFGAQLTVPLGKTSERNSYKAAKAAEEQANLDLKQREQRTLIRIEDDIASARSSFERVDATREARRYAEAALSAEQKKLENGKSTSFVVLQLQKDLTTAASAEIRALADYNIALAALAFSEGSTLERRKVNIEIK